MLVLPLASSAAISLLSVLVLAVSRVSGRERHMKLGPRPFEVVTPCGLRYLQPRIMLVLSSGGWVPQRAIPFLSLMYLFERNWLRPDPASVWRRKPPVPAS